MSAEQNHKTWAAADFERYYSGKMPEAEMHALEKAALDDPFLEDALEGYAFTKTPVADIGQLQQKLFSANDANEAENDKARVVWFKTRAASQLFKAAAMLIVFAGLAYFLFNKNNKPATDAIEIAAVDNAIKKDTGNSIFDIDDSVPAIAKLDDNVKEDIIKQSSPATNTNSAPVSTDNTVPAQQEELTRNANVLKDKQSYKINPATAQNAPVKSEKSNAPAIVPTKEAEQIASNKNQAEIRGRVVDNNGNAVPFATVRNNTDSRQQTVSADVNGNFSLQNNAPANNAINVEVNASGYETAQSRLANNSVNNTIVLNQGQEKLSEVVVTGMNAKKAKAPVGADYYFDASGNKVKYVWNGKNTYIQLRNATPLEGWPYFYYVMNDSLITKDIQFEQQNGKVTLQFDVDAAGAIHNVEVKKSLNELADIAAKNILLKSPVLKLNNKQKKGEAVIKFGL